MANWTPGEWITFLTALGTFVSVVLTAINVFLSNLAKNKSTENAQKIAENTQLTREGTKAAADHAQEAAKVAGAAKAATEVLSVEIAEQLNGNMDQRITRIVREHTEPLVKSFAEHNLQDEKNMQEIMGALRELKEKK